MFSHSARRMATSAVAHSARSTWPSSPVYRSPLLAGGSRMRFAAPPIRLAKHLAATQHGSGMDTGGPALFGNPPDVKQLSTHDRATLESSAPPLILEDDLRAYIQSLVDQLSVLINEIPPLRLLMLDNLEKVAALHKQNEDFQADIADWRGQLAINYQQMDERITALRNRTAANARQESDMRAQDTLWKLHEQLQSVRATLEATDYSLKDMRGDLQNVIDQCQAEMDAVQTIVDRLPRPS